MSDVQHQVREAIDLLVESGAEQGLQVDVYQNGEQVVDAVAGTADPSTGRPVESDTVFYTYPVGKAMTSTLSESCCGLVPAHTISKDPLTKTLPKPDRGLPSLYKPG